MSNKDDGTADKVRQTVLEVVKQLNRILDKNVQSTFGCLFFDVETFADELKAKYKGCKR